MKNNEKNIENIEPLFIDYYDFYQTSPIKQMKICIISGVHGNEPAGCYTLTNLIKDGIFDFWSYYGLYIRIIPCVNKYGLKNNTRYSDNKINPDINRNFLENGLDPISKELIRLTKDFDIILDFHEGYDFHLRNSKSIGSTITPDNSSESIKLANICVDKVNENIIDPLKKFTVLNGKACDIESAFSCYITKSGKKCLLIETSGQNDLQPMNIRYNQIETIIFTVFEKISPLPLLNI